MTLPEATRWILWCTFWGLAAWVVLLISMERYDATISQVLWRMNLDCSGMVGAILLGLWTHTFWLNRP